MNIADLEAGLELLSEEEQQRLWTEEAARRDAELDADPSRGRSAEDVFRSTGALAALHLLDDEGLWRAARQRLASEKAAKIEELHLKRQSEGLSIPETDALAALMKEYTQIILVRSRSAALLKQRGHDVSGLLEGNEP